MNAPDARTHHLIVFAVWIVIGIGATCFFFGSKNAKLKRRVFPWFVIGAGATFVVYVILTTDRSPFELLFFPVIGLITFLNIRMTKFCDSCGAMIFNQTWF